ncbi:MAG: pyridoxamine 5'-phosphate oxidase family protein [Desulfomonile tiedjei]|uniref:Pyridoxamine 5'-phosphate oxidase family protein n=1 Tax=Desulfomonile tiedjei TaxID=2358 RepID=A0A9D6V8V7_9BACT|nr:pyridoxamine 5'-phosphate oxidase family protein [Desulfomonile tiedjei]
MRLEELESIVTSFMDSHTTMTLACCMEDAPWAAAVYYARHELDLIFFSSPRSRHCLAFEQNDRASATIHGEYAGWREIQGLQLEGHVQPITSSTARIRAITSYVKRHPFVREFLSDPLSIGSQAAKKISKVDLYVFRPDAIFYVNNEAGFGTRWKLDVKLGKAAGTPVLA